MTSFFFGVAVCGWLNTVIGAYNWGNDFALWLLFSGMVYMFVGFVGFTALFLLA